MGRSAGPNGTVRSVLSSVSLSAPESFTPTVGPKRPANMLPFTNAPRFPNIGLITTPGRSGISERKCSFSASDAFGISTVNLRKGAGQEQILLQNTPAPAVGTT